MSKIHASSCQKYEFLELGTYGANLSEHFLARAFSSAQVHSENKALSGE